MRKALFICTFVLSLFLALSALAQNQSTSTLLPKAFGGWTVGQTKNSTDAAVADPTNAAMLKEDGFKELEQAEYVQPGRKIAVKAIRFADTSGAYSAFTLYRTPEMDTFMLGQDEFQSLGASLNDSVMFFKNNVLVTVTFDRIDPMTLAKVRELASLLPDPKGTSVKSPGLPPHLPRQSYVKNSVKYIMGPAGMELAGAPIPAQLVEFDKGAEVVTGKYSTGHGTATLTIISYPTPAIAGDRDRAIEAYSQNASSTAQPDVAPPFFTKRSAGLVAFTSGKISPDEAKSLLASVNSDLQVTWNQNTRMDNYAGFLVSLITLTSIILLLCLVAGVAFGGFRILMGKLYPGKVFNRSEDVEIIQLNIRK